MTLVVALLAGVLFGAGLTIARMVDPNKVLNFFDFAAIPAGTWDPTLMFVFLGALPVMFVAFRLQRRMAKPAFDVKFRIPDRSDIDAPLVFGAALFGIGWGLVGLCPGPSIAALALAGPALSDLAIFIAAMLAGMAISLLWRRWTSIPSRHGR